VASPYTLSTRSQNGAEELLDRLGALAEIRAAVIAHCDANAPAPLYKPQEIKRRLGPLGWRPELRVPAYSPDWDHLRGNERYDLCKQFDEDGETAGVAIEIEKWEIQNDLLKFRRGVQRGMIAAGVILHDGPRHLDYCFEHLRHVSEPLFGHIPILFCAPAGPGVV
jgi:hypothetical protein